MLPRLGRSKIAFNPRIKAATPVRADQSASPIDTNVVTPNVALLALSNPSIWVWNNLKTPSGIKPAIKSSCDSTTIGSAKIPNKDIVAAMPGKIANNP